MGHQKPGFRLDTTLEDQPGGKLGLRFSLPGGVAMLVDGPPVAAKDIADVNVMYYPDQCVQILILPRRGNQLQQLRIPIGELPPHKRP